MTVPDPATLMRRVALDQASITTLLLPQTALPGLLTAPIFAYEYPRKVAGQPASGYSGHDWSDLLTRRLIELVLITPAGRVASAADQSRAQWSRFRFDVQTYGRTFVSAAAVHWAVYEYFKSLSNVRAVLGGGTALVHDVTVEAGPISFPDPDTDGCPVMVGTYAASVAEQFVA